jgi:hypothetical protein
VDVIPGNLHWTAMAILATFAAALGQGGDAYGAPVLEHAPPWQAIVCTIAGVLAICAIAFKNARRTHLD